MIARARRAFPGMVVSLMLAAPLVAHPAEAQVRAEPARAGKHVAVHAKPQAIRKAVRSGPKSTAPRSVAVESGAAHRAVEHHGRASVAAAGHAHHAVTRARIVPASSLGVTRPIHRTASHTPVLIDDGTMWRESGSLATWQQTGVASWYGGRRWEGHRTTSGARYHQGELTAAHATLPLGTRVRVTLHDNSGRSVVVVINDRPGTRTRIIDLSREAAAKLGILDRGVAMVTLTPL